MCALLHHRLCKNVQAIFSKLKAVTKAKLEGEKYVVECNVTFDQLTVSYRKYVNETKRRKMFCTKKTFF